MDNVLLDEYRNAYKNIVQKKKEYNKKRARLEFLLNNRLVKEYIALSEELGDDRVISFMKREDDTQIRYLFGEFCRKSKTTSEIYVYLGTYKCSYDCDIVHSEPDEQVSRNDESANYSLYRNIEFDSSMMINIRNREEFENNHTIIYPDRNYFYIGRRVNFDKIQTEFARDLIDYGQEEAVKRVLAKSRKMK